MAAEREGSPDARGTAPRRGVVGRVVGRVVPAVVDRVDIDELLEHLDVNAIADRLDLDALVDRLDVNAVAERLDLELLVDRLDVNAVAGRLDLDGLIERLDVDAVVDRLDVDAVAGRLDLDALVERLDVDAVAGRLDLDGLVRRLDVDAVVERLDVDAVAGRLDLEALVDRLDVDRVAGRLDVDALVERLDVNAVAERVDIDIMVERVNMAQIAAGATQDVATSGLDLVRRQLIRADATVERVVDRTLRRKRPRPVAPGLLAVEPAMAEDTGDQAETEPRRSRVAGHYAGPVTRLLSIAGDVFGSLAAFGGLATVFLYLLGTFAGADVSIKSGSWIALLVGAVWYLVWFWATVALFGRTPAMALVGLAVVDRNGRAVSKARSLLRVLVLPLSVVLLGLGLIGNVVGKERRALHDVAAGTVVVYDWGTRDAEQPATIRELLSARVQRRSQR